jgi:hypothetical protein
VQQTHYNYEKTKAFDTGKMKYNKIVETFNPHIVDLLEHTITKSKMVHVKGTEKPQAKKLVQKNQQQKKTRGKRKNLLKETRPDDHLDLLITEVNMNPDKYSWKADTCMYTRKNPLRGKDCPSDTLMLAQIEDDHENLVELDSKHDGFGDMNNPKFVKALEKAQKFMKKYAHADDIKDEELPENHDFRNIDGFDFTSSHRDQGHCGSCYTLSFT